MRGAALHAIALLIVPAAALAVLPPLVDLDSPAADMLMRVYGHDSADLLGSGDANGIAFGDFDGDGIDDLAIGAYKADGIANISPDTGEVVIIFGAATRTASTVDLANISSPPVDGSYTIIYGSDIEDYFGRAITAGDFDGDGIDDLAIAAYGADGAANDSNTVGEVRILWGGASVRGKAITNLNALGAAKLIGEHAEEGFGWSLAAGDVDNDGISDLAVGAPGGNLPGLTAPGKGRAYLFFGSSTLRNQTIQVDTTQPNPAMAVIFGGGAIAQMASNIALGDIDGDGNTDLLFGAPHSAYGDSRTFAGQAFIVWGSSALRGARHGIDVVGYTAPPSLTRFIGARENDFLAISVATGYFDRARGEEVVLGVLQGGRTAGETSGAVLVFPGGSALRGQSFDQSEPETRAPFRIYGDSSARTFGFAVSTADINDDGYDDILAAAPISSGPAGTRTDAGEVFIIKGRPVLPATSSNAALIASTRIFGQANNGGGFGYALEGGGDLNNDGTPDLAAAAIFDNHPTLTSQDGVGRVFVLFGEPEPQDVWMFY